MSDPSSLQPPGYTPDASDYIPIPVSTSEVSGTSPLPGYASESGALVELFEELIKEQDEIDRNKAEHGDHNSLSDYRALEDYVNRMEGYSSDPDITVNSTVTIDVTYHSDLSETENIHYIEYLPDEVDFPDQIPAIVPVEIPDVNSVLIISSLNDDLQIRSDDKPYRDEVIDRDFHTISARDEQGSSNSLSDLDSVVENDLPDIQDQCDERYHPLSDTSINHISGPEESTAKEMTDNGSILKDDLVPELLRSDDAQVTAETDEEQYVSLCSEEDVSLYEEKSLSALKNQILLNNQAPLQNVELASDGPEKPLKDESSSSDDDSSEDNVNESGITIRCKSPIPPAKLVWGLSVDHLMDRYLLNEYLNEESRSQGSEEFSEVEVDADHHVPGCENDIDEASSKSEQEEQEDEHARPTLTRLSNALASLSDDTEPASGDYPIDDIFIDHGSVYSSDLETDGPFPLETTYRDDQLLTSEGNPDDTDQPSSYEFATIPEESETESSRDIEEFLINEEKSAQQTTYDPESTYHDESDLQTSTQETSQEFDLDSPDFDDEWLKPDPISPDPTSTDLVSPDRTSPGSPPKPDSSYGAAYDEEESSDEETSGSETGSDCSDTLSGNYRKLCTRLNRLKGCFKAGKFNRLFDYFPSIVERS